MRLSKSMIAAAALVALTGTALAAGEATIEARKQNMKTIGGEMKAIAAVLKGESSDTASLPTRTKTMAEAAAKSKALFQEKALGGETAAKPEIWGEWDRFAAGLDAMQAETAKLAAISPTDKAAFGAQVGVVGKICKNCHDTYKEKK